MNPSQLKRVWKNRTTSQDPGRHFHDLSDADIFSNSRQEVLLWSLQILSDLIWKPDREGVRTESALWRRCRVEHVNADYPVICPRCEIFVVRRKTNGMYGAGMVAKCRKLLRFRETRVCAIIYGVCGPDAYVAICVARLAAC